MSASTPLQSQTQFSVYDDSTPPPPPPKPSAHSSGHGTPLSGPPLPPPPRQSPHPNPSSTPGYTGAPGPFPQHHQQAPEQITPAPEPGWLPDIVKQQNTTDLTTLLRDAALQSAVLNSPSTTHPSLPTSNAQLGALLSTNLGLAQQLVSLEAHLRTRREATQSRLLSLRALERQWRAKQAEQDAALRDFSAPALYQRLVAAVGEGEEVCRGMEENFVHARGEHGERLGEREVADFVRRYREARKVAFLRRERKERWDEGRVGGWR